MKGSSYEIVKRILSDYLEKNKLRKTSERFAILKAVYSFKSFFSIQDLGDKMQELRFPISRATIYNALKLFVKLKLVACHHIDVGTRYEASLSSNHCVRICTSCGKVEYIDSPEIVKAIENTRFMRFHREGFSMFVYGTCSSCIAIRTRLSKKNKKFLNNKNTGKKNAKK